MFRAFYHIFFLHPFGANLSTESFANNAVLISLSALFDIFNFTDSGKHYVHYNIKILEFQHQFPSFHGNQVSNKEI